uniref:Uncharacterized protein n=1 Tax=Trypanosoma congolense (strain IL3000) TaxID=1068625 RepID=G0UL86_TRYCI|nr:hypothetical protein, unlikely [Trypanosoma congolense IL3000]
MHKIMQQYRRHTYADKKKRDMKVMVRLLFLKKKNQKFYRYRNSMGSLKGLFGSFRVMSSYPSVSPYFTFQFSFLRTPPLTVLICSGHVLDDINTRQGKQKRKLKGGAKCLTSNRHK